MRKPQACTNQAPDRFLYRRDAGGGRFGQQLTRQNLVLTPDGELLGVRDRLASPQDDDYQDGVLSPSETVTVPFDICLKQRTSFQFFVDAYGGVED